jgi:nucleoside-diphosphate-sugar epimerase
VLVTGAAGFTGRHLCAHLRECGYRVFGLVEHATDDPD